MSMRATNHKAESCAILFLSYLNFWRGPRTFFSQTLKPLDIYIYYLKKKIGVITSLGPFPGVDNDHKCLLLVRSTFHVNLIFQVSLNDCDVD
jgi:hypothetical protein